jgi:lipopolysaccharide export system protein LptC
MGCVLLERSLREPLFLVPEDEGGMYWDLRAATGWISADSEQMRLQGKVVAISDPTGDRAMRLETETLEVLPRQRRARSDAAVTITQPGTTMRGTGMEVDLADKRFQLTSKVHTRYVPTRR